MLLMLFWAVVTALSVIIAACNFALSAKPDVAIDFLVILAVLCSLSMLAMFWKDARRHRAGLPITLGATLLMIVLPVALALTVWQSCTFPHQFEMQLDLGTEGIAIMYAALLSLWWVALHPRDEAIA